MHIFRTLSKATLALAIGSAAFFGSAAPAHAVLVTDTITINLDFSSATTNFSTPSSPVNFALFDSNLGTLTSVQLKLALTGTTGGTVKYDPNATATGTLDVTPQVKTWFAGVSSGLNTLLGGSSYSTAIARVTVSGATDSFGPDNAGTVETLTTSAISGNISKTLTSGFSAFEAVGGGTDALLLKGQSAASIVTSGTWDTSTVGGTGGGAAQIIYTYTHDVPQVPEPASMALLGTGLIGIGAVVRRRTRKG